MRKDKLCEKIIKEHYATIFRFCIARLAGDYYGAEECRQEVFLLLLQKQDLLDLDDQIDRWLIASASRITKKYIRKKAERAAFETEASEAIVAPQIQTDVRASVFDALTDEEYCLLMRYYSMNNELRSELASELGISINTLYQRIHTIKSKLKPPK